MENLFQVGSSYYGDYIAEFHNDCQKCVVSLRFHRKDDTQKAQTIFRTGIVFASGNNSCCIITSDDVKRPNEVCEVQFFDGTKKEVGETSIKVQKNFKIGVILVLDIDAVHWKAVTFSENEVSLYERVFTCGYNSNTKESSFISGHRVGGVGIKNKTSKDATIFVHGCSTGSLGHIGSGVFNETHHLVGMNFFYTKSKGVVYLCDPDDQDYGGIVSALDLQSIRLGLSCIYKDMQGKSLSEIVQSVNCALA